MQTAQFVNDDREAYVVGIITPRFVLQTASFINAPHDNSRRLFTVWYTEYLKVNRETTKKIFVYPLFIHARSLRFSQYTGCSWSWASVRWNSLFCNRMRNVWGRTRRQLPIITEHANPFAPCSRHYPTYHTYWIN